ncbi:hypothetical protein HHK36_022054 [Tetracentron sinense]|uniref:FAR1 domain-containing protein n=1 Tax=Tetracentron sinense TaxID=13715 RepID=A0A834YPC2_TETSI|nr:hypothetical protein HHK36_022054 [Tetracentron sinense]
MATTIEEDGDLHFTCIEFDDTPVTAVDLFLLGIIRRQFEPANWEKFLDPNHGTMQSPWYPCPHGNFIAIPVNFIDSLHIAHIKPSSFGMISTVCNDNTADFSAGGAPLLAPPLLSIKFCNSTSNASASMSIMESTSGQGLDSDESDRGLQSDNFYEHETTEEELSKNLDLCIDEDNKIVPITISAEALEPYIGMEFNSRDEAREFYVSYGRRTGFTVRIHHNRRSRVNNAIIGQDFVCSKEGFRAKKYVYRKDRVLPPPPITREGCHAMIRLALKDGEKWVVTKYVKEHTHKLMSPSKVPWRGSGKNSVSEFSWPYGEGYVSSVTLDFMRKHILLHLGPSFLLYDDFPWPCHTLDAMVYEYDFLKV